MPRELEAKFKVENFRRVRKALRAEGGVYLGTAIECDTFFDTPRRDLKRCGRALRLREIRVLKGAPGGRKSGWLLTSKGKPQRNTRAKVRQELQTRIADGEVLAQILRAGGLRETIGIEKRRTTYRLGNCLVELDELPRLGRFVEIEAPSQRALDAARRKLALPDQPITATYTDMLRKRP